MLRISNHSSSFMSGLRVSSVYLILLAGIAILASLMGPVRGAETDAGAAASPAPQPSPTVKPRFSLSTNRTYGSDERSRIYISYQGVASLDFRVYRVRDPFKFFTQLSDPHQMGEEDQEGVSEVAATIERKPSALERLRSFKRNVYFSVKNYFRNQLRRESRAVFNTQFRSGEQLPLNVADYARVPLLNPDQLVGSWRQILPQLDNEYDSRMIPLGRRDAGVYLVEAVNGDLRAYTIVVVTDLTMIYKTTSDGEMLVYSVNRRTGEPRDNVNVRVFRKGKTLAEGITDREGVLRVRLQQDATPKPPAPPEDRDPEEEMETAVEKDYLILAKHRDEFAISDLSAYYFSWNRYQGENPVLWDLVHYIYTDRPIYRPNQTVNFKGILRRMGEGGYEMLEARAVNVTITDPNGGEIYKKDLPLTSRGTISGAVEVGATAPLGSYNIILKIDDSEAGRGYFEVAEYKKPEYKVSVTTPRQYVPVGSQTRFTLDARYFFGEPVRNADVQYYIYRSRYYHWWWQSDDDDGIGESDEEGEGDDEYYGYGNDMVKQGEGKLDENGKMEVSFEVPQPDPKDPYDYTYRLEAQVTDAARRTIEGRTSFVGTRGNIVANAWPERYVYLQNDTAKIRIRTADYEGRPVSARVTLKFVEVKYEKVEKEDNGYKYFEYKPIRNDLSSGDVTTNSQGEASFSYRVPIVGFIDIETIVHEGDRRILSTGGYIYATDRNNRWADEAYRDYGSIKLVADKKSYQPGETAQVLAMLPTDKAHLLVTTEMNRIQDVRHLYAEGRALMIDVPIRESHTPNVYLSIAYVRDGEMYEHRKSLSVPARKKFLQLEITPDKKQYKPRDPASYTVIARNADGTPASGVELSLGVVDEAIYSIRPDTSGDIRRAFYGRRYSRINTNFSSSFSFTGFSGKKQMQLAQNKRAYQLADFKEESQYAEPTIRKEFKDTAYWEPAIVTGADGKATVRFTLPDNLTTWRATARALSPDLSVGSKIEKVISRKDLILRLETPRFLTEGDVVTVSGIVHNYLSEDKVAQLDLKVTGGSLLDKALQTVTVNKQGEQRIDWRIYAPQVGNLTLLATARTNTESDGLEIPLSIAPMGLKQTAGGSAALSEDSAERVFNLNLPSNANVQARTLRIEAAPSIAGALFGALDYLTGYPYGCTEQTMSSFLPNVIVAQVLKDVKTATIRSDNELTRKVQRGMDRLYDYQHADGGWGWWKDDQTDPFMTAYVVNGLAMARGAGFGVDNYRLSRGRDKIKALLDAGKLENGKTIDPESRAYLVYAWYVSGEGEPRYSNDLYSRRNELQPYGRALLALTLHLRGEQNRAKQVISEIERSARVSEFDAHWESTRRPMLDFTENADLEATALSVKALAQLSPQSVLLPKAARWLVSNRRNGYYWDSTKHTAFAIYGLTDYVKLSRELNPDYTVEVYLNGEQVLLKRVTGVEAASSQPFIIERKSGALGLSNQVRIVKRGKGVLYSSATLDYFTRDEQIPARSTQNMNITREYLRLRVTEQNGKARWVIEPLSGQLQSGDLIVARLRVRGARGRYLMIEDPIPAGCEQIDRASGVNLDYSDGRWSDWYNQREFRDQRTAIFADYFDGDATFQYAMRVQIPGEFKVGPARAELMYQPTVQANTANLKLSILDK